ncbi:uncharacterized protein LOC129000275 [Macrosteles quadrilineatus]|uniref:uncharacterized protein LOC129000275 n=1 Tax=Macrosteles quadrilineatus TaxID=74068 RepID=UPI0023E185AD|nr:uncharacterized protein LOC129000275 [Macrosteles quadrilineatus]
MHNTRSHGSTVHSSEREVIRGVIQCCDQEAKDKSLLFPISKATERAANYCKVSQATVKRIRKEGKLTPDSKLSTPGKKRKRPDHRNATIDGFDRRVILDVIREFYVQKKVVPTCKKILPILKERINFGWSDWTLRRVLKEMGFRWKKCKSRRKVLIERNDIVNWRCKYLREIKKFRENGRKIFYLDETWVDGNLTFKKCWQNDEIDGVLSDMNSSNRLIIVDIGSEDGFLTGGRLIYKANSTTGDYHGQMNANNFEKWIRNQVIPNLPEHSVLVIDNAPYHGEQEDKVPTKSATKRTMLEWLQRHGENYDEKSTRKADLLEAIQRLKPPQKIFKIDKLLTEFGHTVVRLPPYMCDLNAIEFVWSKVKHHVRSRNTSGNMSLSSLQELAIEALDSVSNATWKNFCHHVINIEKDYWAKDGLMEEAVDEMIIHLGEESDESSSSSVDGNNDSGSEDNEDMDLAQPLPLI